MCILIFWRLDRNKEEVDVWQSRRDHWPVTPRPILRAAGDPAHPEPGLGVIRVRGSLPLHRGLGITSAYGPASSKPDHGFTAAHDPSSPLFSYGVTAAHDPSSPKFGHGVTASCDLPSTGSGHGLTAAGGSSASESSCKLTAANLTQRASSKHHLAFTKPLTHHPSTTPPTEPRHQHILVLHPPHTSSSLVCPGVAVHSKVRRCSVTSTCRCGHTRDKGRRMRCGFQQWELKSTLSIDVTKDKRPYT